MFKALIDAVDSTLAVVTAPLTGEMPERQDVAKMIAAGMTVGAIAIALDVSEDLVREMLDSQGNDE